MTALPQTLHLGESVELGHAWVQSLADARDIRVLFIKGPALHRHGLREHRQSGDVDVLVEPERYTEFCAIVQDCGWTVRPGSFTDQRTTLHSKTFLNAAWPSDLDVHYFFPGFLAPPVAVFEALWVRRMRMTFAHFDCDVPDRVSAILILALHSLRGNATQTRHASELAQLSRVALSDAEREDMARLALATGCTATLDSFLSGLNVHVEAPAIEAASPQLRYWRERLAAGSHGPYFWILALRASPWREKPKVVWHAIWPTDAELRVGHPDLDGTVRAATRTRLRRLLNGAKSAPRAVRAVLRHRR